MLNRLKGAAVVLLLIVVAGCASPRYRPELPEDIGSDGLLVGQVASIGTLPGWSNIVDVVVIDDAKKGTVVNGFIAIPLRPGEHTLDSFYNSDMSTSRDGRKTTIHRRTLNIKRKFTIRSGEVTDLGLLILDFASADKKPVIVPISFLDNRADMKQFLKYSYPLLAEKVHVDAMTLAPGVLLPDSQLSVLRKKLAARAIKQSGGGVPYVGDRAGTLAEIQTGPDGKPTRFKLITLPTLADLRSASPCFVKDRMAFLTDNNRLFLVENGKAIEKHPPRGLRAGSVFVFGASDIVILDDHVELYTSSDNGDHWESNTGLRTEDVVRPRLAIGKNGYYLYNENTRTLLFSTFGKTEFTSLELPDEIRDLRLVQERPAGIFAEQATSTFKESEHRPFFFRAAGKTAWEKRSMPDRNCQYIGFLEDESVSTECSDLAVGSGGDKVRYVSSDNGISWQKK